MFIANVEAFHTNPNRVEYCPPNLADLNGDKTPSPEMKIDLRVLKKLS
jgi:hypothetical protein